MGFPNYETLIDNVAVGVSLFFIVPNIAITARRMHDIGRSGWTQLISFIPVIGFFIFLVYELRRGDERENSYGERTGYTPITPEVSKATGLEETPSRRQDWAMGIAIFIINLLLLPISLERYYGMELMGMDTCNNHLHLLTIPLFYFIKV